MKTILFAVLVLLVFYIVFSHGIKLNKQNTEIDQISISLDSIDNLVPIPATIGFITNSNDAMQLHFMSQFAFAPRLLETKEPLLDTIIYLEENNLPKSEILLGQSYDTLVKKSINRGKIFLLTQKGR